MLLNISFNESPEPHRIVPSEDDSRKETYNFPKPISSDIPSQSSSHSPSNNENTLNSHTPAVSQAGEAIGLDDTRVALIIETRPIPHLPALLTQFISTLPPQWIVKHVGDALAFELVRSHKPLRRHIQSGKLRLVSLPSEYPTKNNEDLSATLTSLTFYRDFLAPAEWLLMFQTDSMICSGSETDLDDWVDKGYDWVGAPWHPNRAGGNGGLSLRHIPPIVELLKTETRKANDSAWEDLWLCERLKNAAPASIESAFSVESTYHERPFGYHLRSSGKGLDAGVWQNRTRRRIIMEYCPEIKVALGIMGLESPREDIWRKEDLGLAKPNAQESINEVLDLVRANKYLELSAMEEHKDEWTLKSKVSQEKPTEGTSKEKPADGASKEKPASEASKEKPAADASKDSKTTPSGINVDQNAYGDSEDASKNAVVANKTGAPAESKALKEALTEETGARWKDDGKKKATTQ